MKFITYNDSPGGIYRSQVIDVCRFLHDQFNVPVELIAFVSLRTFLKDRRKIKKEYKNATVIPSFPGIENWRKNQKTLNFIMSLKKEDKVITRGVFATHLALNCKKFSAICFDSRGAYAAEWIEYLHTESIAIKNEINELEKEALVQTNFKIAVSSQLVKYWEERYGYTTKNNVVIPCTIESSLIKKTIFGKENLRKKMGLNDTDIVLIYSGSSAGWQSMSTLYQILKNAFTKNSSLKLVVLSKNASENELSKAFPDRIIYEWVSSEQVPYYLQAADYGILYREETITNKVSSPVKFAEYLAAGLPVIISNNIGDYSQFVEEKNCGMLFNNITWENLTHSTDEEKQKIKKIALTYLTKSAYIEKYKQVIEMK